MERINYYEVEYMGGHPDWPKTSKIELSVRKTYNDILLHETGFWSENKKLHIDADEIVSVDLEEKKTRSLGKTAAGAIIGGVLTGGVGLLVGGAIGASKNNKSNIYLTIDYKGRNLQVILKTGKYTNAIYSEICGLFST